MPWPLAESGAGCFVPTVRSRSPTKYSTAKSVSSSLISSARALSTCGTKVKRLPLVTVWTLCITLRRSAFFLSRLIGALLIDLRADDTAVTDEVDSGSWCKMTFALRLVTPSGPVELD
jgi:hypothetical protein